MGVCYIWCSVVVSPRVGVATMLSLVIAGQMVASLLIDHFGLMQMPMLPATLPRLLGAALLITGAALMAFFR